MLSFLILMPLPSRFYSNCYSYFYDKSLLQHLLLSADPLHHSLKVMRPTRCPCGHTIAKMVWWDFCLHMSFPLDYELIEKELCLTSFIFLDLNKYSLDECIFQVQCILFGFLCFFLVFAFYLFLDVL
uniref:Uncharacterized protein n=1 Tax=Myotis myotis TaxID=51298 RepID=A0A7J7ZXC6_MYOMY|nr:hypothetical protein mMyoMyo1_009840 [Myotis myotis]